MADVLTVADIVGVYGIKGWVKIRPHVEDPEMLVALAPLKVAPQKLATNARTQKEPPLLHVTLRTVRPQGKGYVASVEGVEDRTQAEALVGLSLQVAMEQLPEAGEGEYYWRDLIGLAVWLQEVGSSEPAILVGCVDHLLETGANDVLVVKATTNSIDDRERLIPFILGDVVTGVDLHEQRLTVTWYVDA